MRIVGAQGAVSFSDVRTADGRLTMRGEASIRILLASEEGETVVSRGRAAIEETMELPELPPEMKCRAAVFPSVVMTEAEAADDGTVSWRMEYDADTVLMKCGEGEITADAYSPDGPTEAGIRDCTSVAPAAAHNGRLTVSVRMNARPGASFLWAWGNAVCDRVTVQGGRAQASGTLRITAVSRAGEEILAEEISVPLRYEWEAVPDAADAEDGALSGRVAVTVTDIAVRGGAAREDGEEWNLTAEAAVCAVLVAPENVRALVTLMPIDGEGCPDTKNVIRVYVPEADESPWDVEKKFRLGCEAVPSGGVYVI